LTAPKRSKKRKHAPPELGSSEDVISREVVELLGRELVAQAEADGVERESPFGFREEVELTVSSISPSGMSFFRAVQTRATGLVHICPIFPRIYGC
jgi:tRNA (uracil-5-)-methyltransferase